MPGPKGLPLLGDLISFLMEGTEFKERMAALESAFKRYGPVFKRTILGRTIVFIEDPKDVEIVFKADGRYPMRPDVLFKPVKVYFESREMPTFLGSLEGKEWSRSRKVMAPKMLRPKDIRDNLENFNSVTRDAIEHLVSIRGGDMVIPDLEKELAKWSTESVGTMVFDARVGLYDDPQNKDAVDMIHATLETFACWGKLVTGWESVLFRFATTPSYRKFCKAQDTMLAIGQKFVDNKVMELNNMAEQGNSFVDDQVVPLLTYLIMKGEFTPAEININAIGMFRAGVDTTSSAMLWLLYDLANNRRVQEKVYEEVTSLIGPHGDFTPESFAKLDYLKACLKETMRLHPVSGGWARLLSQDVVLAGNKVPTGTMVVYNNYLSGRSKELFKCHLEYKPERWLSEELGKIHPFSSLPFGVGSRMCIGRRIAEAEMYLLAAKLVQRFILEYHGEPVGTKQKLLIVPDRTVKIKFIDRE